ncbi:hypothetical protein HAX54_020326 [Datura stramonium]|uniref:beta-galactosidase n=1 Tax=Datura stramonium TaxID=4076 RepID=A0ABS8UTS2_DATST|nr:hypothetical protein [Datura stramonium]
MKPWFASFGNPVPYRPAEDLAFVAAKFIQKGGSFINSCMYHGGLNIGWTAGKLCSKSVLSLAGLGLKEWLGQQTSISYDYCAPLDEYQRDENSATIWELSFVCSTEMLPWENKRNIQVA